MTVAEAPLTRPVAVTVAAATGMEWRALRQRLAGLEGVQLRQVGLALHGWSPDPDSTVVTCGVAGALTGELAPGTVVVPQTVGLTDGRRQACDPALVALLSTAAARLGAPVHHGPLLTSPHLVRGPERSHWAELGYAAVDMETGLLIGRVRCFAAVRVVLDGPDREFDAAWLRPWAAAARPWLWGEAVWLAAVAPRRAALAARVLARALAPSPGDRAPDRSAPPARRGW